MYPDMYNLNGWVNHISAMKTSQKLLHIHCQASLSILPLKVLVAVNIDGMCPVYLYGWIRLGVLFTCAVHVCCLQLENKRIAFINISAMFLAATIISQCTPTCEIAKTSWEWWEACNQRAYSKLTDDLIDTMRSYYIWTPSLFIALFC